MEMNLDLLMRVFLFLEISMNFFLCYSIMDMITEKWDAMIRTYTLRYTGESKLTQHRNARLMTEVFLPHRHYEYVVFIT